MEFELLGSVEVNVAGRRLRVGRRQERCALVVLLLEAGRPVSIDRLADRIWGGEPPEQARDVVQTYLSRLRTFLKGIEDDSHDAPGIHRSRDGYVIDVDPLRVDAHRFEALVRQAEATRPPEQRAGLLRSALALWRGPALADIGPDQVRLRLAARLEERRRSALDLRIAADLAAGQHREILGELLERMRDCPLDERLNYFLMLAQSRAGRRQDALETFRVLRQRLRDELGLDPSAEVAELHKAVLRGGEAGPATVTRPAVQCPRQLPLPPTGFVAREPGRAAELAALNSLVDNGRVPIAVVTGVGGVGKTSLVLHWAHSAVGRFPDGQLFADMGGWSSGPRSHPVTVLGRFLRGLGVPQTAIPVDVDEAIALYRTEMADRRMLVVLDNVRSAEEARPLLPGSAACLVVITSRNSLTGLQVIDGAAHLSLGSLTEQESLTLLESRLDARRLETEPAAVGRVARLCAGLPLALRVAAVHLGNRTAGSIEDYATRLERDRLRYLSPGDDPQSSLTATFRLSYDQLSGPERHMFRMLGLAPGSHLCGEAAAAVAGVDADSAGKQLERLVDAHLLTEVSPDRFTQHDLVRAFATRSAEEQDSEEERRTALRRLYEWYLIRADSASAILYPQMVRLPAAGPLPAAAQPVAGPLAWLDAEHTNLINSVLSAAADGEHDTALLLADRLRGFLWQRGYFTDWLTVARAALSSARARRDWRGRGSAYTSLSQVHFCVGDLTTALHYGHLAVQANRRFGWGEGKAPAHHSVADAYWHLAQPDKAARHYSTAVEVARRHGRADYVYLNNLAGVLLETGRIGEAVETFARALDGALTASATSLAVIAQLNLGDAWLTAGETQAALRAADSAETLARQAEHRVDDFVLNLRAAAHRDAGRLEQARRDIQAAMAMAAAGSSVRPAAEAVFLNTLASIEREYGEFAAAAEHHAQAQRIAASRSKFFAETVAVIGRAQALHGLGQPEPARRAAVAGLKLARRRGYRVLQADALAALAAILRTSDLPRGRQCALHAAAIYRQTGARERLSSGEPGYEG